VAVHLAAGPLCLPLWSLARRGRVERVAAFGQCPPEGTEVGAGARLGQQDRVLQQGLGRRESPCRRACRHRLQTLGEAARNYRKPADQVALPFELAVRQVDAVDREDGLDHRLSRPGQQVPRCQVIAAGGQRVPCLSPPSLPIGPVRSASPGGLDQ
jgi:hypothetical protein